MVRNATIQVYRGVDRMELLINIITMFLIAIPLGIGIRIGETFFDKIKDRYLKKVDKQA